MTLLTKGEKMSNTNTPSLKASIKEYEESTTETFLGKIQKPELVDKYLGRMMLQLKFVESGGASKQTRSIDLSDSHISNLADSLEREIQYDQPPLMVFKSNEEKYVIVQGEHRLQALKRLGFEDYFFDVIDIDIDHPGLAKNHQYNHWYSLISNRSNDHTPAGVPKLTETSASMLTDISNGLLDREDFSMENQDKAESWVSTYRPSASTNQVKNILRRVREDLDDIGTFRTLKKEKARPVAQACGLSDDVHIVSHDMLNRYYYDFLCTGQKHDIVVRINSSNFALNSEQLKTERNNCIDTDHKYSLRTEKSKLRSLGVSDAILNRVKVKGFLPQGNNEPSTKLITLTNKQRLV